MPTKDYYLQTGKVVLTFKVEYLDGHLTSWRQADPTEEGIRNMMESLFSSINHEEIMKFVNAELEDWS